MGKAEKSKESWQERRKKIRYKLAVPFVFAEWICEGASNLLKRWAFLDILGHVGRLAILIAVVSYFMEADERRIQAENQRKTKQYQAWQVINIAHGKTGGGGRKDALEDLHKDKVSLGGVDISKAYLPDLNLSGGANLIEANLSEAVLTRANLSGAALADANLSEAKLVLANLSGAFLVDANLSGAELSKANLSGATLISANLSDADLSEANLSGGATLISANLSGADLSGAELSEANLTGADLSGADLSGANLSGANLIWADLSEAKLSGADLSEAKIYEAELANIADWQNIKSIEYANIYGVETPPDGFIEWAKEQDAVSIEDPNEWKKLIREEAAEETKRGK